LARVLREEFVLPRTRREHITRTFCGQVSLVRARTEGQLVGKAGAPDRIRTCDLCLRRATLYPTELRVLGSREPRPNAPNCNAAAIEPNIRSQKPEIDTPWVATSRPSCLLGGFGGAIRFSPRQWDRSSLQF